LAALQAAGTSRAATGGRTAAGV
ncbi:MAG: hypothetical protein JWR63_3598, partial [Conexibacter sp.]|nr:hypothetical protein [Conexibacter sp.]